MPDDDESVALLGESAVVFRGDAFGGAAMSSRALLSWSSLCFRFMGFEGAVWEVSAMLEPHHGLPWLALDARFKLKIGDAGTRGHVYPYNHNWKRDK